MFCRLAVMDANAFCSGAVPRVSFRRRCAGRRAKRGRSGRRAVGTIPEAVEQLAVDPANDSLLFAQTGTRLWAQWE